jgi:hypothetical protein
MALVLLLAQILDALVFISEQRPLTHQKEDALKLIKKLAQENKVNLKNEKGEE